MEEMGKHSLLHCRPEINKGMWRTHGSWVKNKEKGKGNFRRKTL
jgi:hypothetical protein